MPKFASKNALDNGLKYISFNSDILFVTQTYALGDTYEDIENNQLINVFLSDDDFTITDGAGESRVLVTTPGRQAQLLKPGVSGGVDMHFCFCNGTTHEVIWVTDESSDALISYGSIIIIPSLNYTSAQPV